MENIKLLLINSSLKHVLALFTLINTFHVGSGGICWFSKSKQELCRKYIKINMTEEQCCSITDIPSVSWSPHENPSNGQLWYWEALVGGAPKCHQCHNSCGNITCPKDKACRVKKGKPRCVCKPRCNSEIRRKGHLCGTDGRNYKNYCRLLRHNCKKDRTIEIAYFGRCKRSCRKVTCMDGKYCLEDQNGIPHCVQCQATCPIKTPPEYVCGDDGETYKSVCHIRVAVCLKRINVKAAYTGRCKENATCDNTFCPPGHTCLKQLHFDRPQCFDCRRSKFDCRKARKKMRVCGTDENTYRSSCELRRRACRKGHAIYTKSNGPCKKKRNRTCKRCKRKWKRRQKKRTFLRSLLRQNIIQNLNDKPTNTIPVKQVKLLQIVRHSGKEIVDTDADFG